MHGDPGELLPLPQGAAAARRARAARGRLRPARPRPRGEARAASTTAGRGLGRWTGEAIDALGIERCHLVLHDIGGPIGLEWALRNRDRVKTLTVLDTLIDVAHFRRVWTMRPGRAAGDRPALGGDDSPARRRAGSSTCRGSPTAPPPRPTRSDAHHRPAPPRRRRALLPADRPRLRADRGEGALLRGRRCARPAGRARSSGASATRRWARTGAARFEDALGIEADRAPRQALPPGGPGARGRRRRSRTSRLGLVRRRSRLGQRLRPLLRALLDQLRARRARGRGSRPGRSRAGRRCSGRPRAPRRAPRRRCSGRRRGRSRASPPRPRAASCAASRAVE